MERSVIRDVYASRTSFIPASTVNHFEERAWPAVPSAGEGAAPTTRLPIDIRAKLRQAWR